MITTMEIELHLAKIYAKESSLMWWHDPNEIRRRAGRFVYMNDVLYRHSYDGPLLPSLLSTHLL